MLPHGGSRKHGWRDSTDAQTQPASYPKALDGRETTLSMAFSLYTVCSKNGDFAGEPGLG